MLCWDVKKGELVSRWRDKDCSAAVTAISRSKADPDIFAVGHADGSIRLWDARIAIVIIVFNGHRSAITHLSFDRTGVRLASGSTDTDVIVWDLVAESGLFKLRGHKGQITGLHFVQLSSDSSPTDGATASGVADDAAEGFLMSTSKDALIKIWDIASQYCIETHVTQSSGECWALSVSPDESGCITAGNDGELKAWSLDVQGLRAHTTQLNLAKDKTFLHGQGTLYRQGKDRTIGIRFHPRGDYIAIHGSEKAVELWRVRSEEEVKKVMARKRRRRREKPAVADGADVDGDTEMVDGEENISEAAVNDVFVQYMIVRTGGKIRSVDWAKGSRPSKMLQLLAASTNNQIELYDIPAYSQHKKNKASEEPDYQRSLAVELPGHRTDVRAVSLSSDDKMLATASNGSIKIWNVSTSSCLRTLECGYALCCAFLPGDKIVLVGNKSGDVEVFDVASSTLIDTVKAHEGAVWSMRVHPDGKAVVTGSADKSAKFWRFDASQEEIPGTKRTTSRLKLVHTRTLKLNDDILALCFTPDSRLLAVSTLDNTVKVFFVDTLKLFLNLYGHKLPVLHISIASDSKLLATCSADKNIRLWGLDFGDCHKALFAHDDSIMNVSFIAEPTSRDDAHTLFSASKDGLLKTWDADKFLAVQKLSGHHSELWTMAVSRTGDFVVTASHDKSIRIWRLNDEPLFLEEEREKELEDLHDRNLAETMDKDAAEADALDARDGETAEVASASKQTGATLTAGEKIIEALSMCTEDLDATTEYEDERAANPNAGLAAPQRHPVLSLRNLPPETHMLSVLAAIPVSSLQDALLLLPFSTIPPLFTFLSLFLAKQTNVPLTCRVLFFLLRTHHKQIVASRELRPLLGVMRERLRGSLGEWKEVLGWNLAACRVLGERMGVEKVGRLEDVGEQDAKGANARKRGFVTVA